MGGAPHTHTLATLVMTTMSGHFQRRARHQVWVPDDYDAARRWPAILFLHGAGERGDDNEKQTTVGLGPWLRDGTLDPPAIVVFPQCPMGVMWTNAGAIAIDALDDTLAEFAVHDARVSLTGISMGGVGVWALAAAHPDRWSAIAPVCGWSDRPWPLPPIPTWIFHGSDDTIIHVEHSRTMAARLGAQAKYMEFAGVGHNSWDPAYSTTDVVAWLVRQRRP